MDSSSSSLCSQLTKAALRLRPCSTVVTRTDGRCYVEKRTHSNDKRSNGTIDESGSNEPSDTISVPSNLENITSEKATAEILSVDGPPATLQFNEKCPGFIIDTKPDLRCSVILPYLLLGSQDVANDEEILIQHNVTHVLSLLPASVFEEKFLVLLQDGSVVSTKQDSVAVVETKLINPPDVNILKSESSSGKFDSNNINPTKELNSPSRTRIDQPNNLPFLNTSCEAIPACCTSSLERIHAPMLDCPEFPVIEHFESCHRYISRVEQSGGVVLVHCNAGVSRAPSVILAYLMKQFGYTYQHALKLVRKQRSFVRPNVGFVNQLLIYEKMLADVKTT